MKLRVSFMNLASNTSRTISDAEITYLASSGYPCLCLLCESIFRVRLLEKLYFTLINLQAAPHLKTQLLRKFMEKTSVIITAFREPKTIGKAIQVIAKQLGNNDEILVVAPDNETLEEAKKIKDKRVKLIKDAGKGKPAAMNLAVKHAKGEILVWTDGDVSISQNSIAELTRPLKDNSVGAVTGRSVSIDSQKDKYAFWGCVLSEVAHERRFKATQTAQRIFCSGYLFAIKKELM